MKRRNFFQNLVVVPAAAVIADAQQTVPPPAQPATPQTKPEPVPAANTPAQQLSQMPAREKKPSLNLRTTEVDLTAETVTRYFKPEQFEALKKLSGLLMPPLKGNPGAIEAQAPEFLDFLISESPPKGRNCISRAWTD